MKSTAVRTSSAETPKAPASATTDRMKAPRIKAAVSKEGMSLSVEALGESLARAFGTTEPAFIDGLLHQILNVTAQGKTPDHAKMDFLTATLFAMKPRDEVETMLLMQMATVHLAAMTFARRINHCDTIQQSDAAERGLNKLMRTYAAQIEALKRYRSNGEQRMTVEHVTVNAGGQAIVGNVARSAGAGASEKSTATP